MASTFCSSLTYPHLSYILLVVVSPLLDDEVRVVNVPAFAESISEGDIRWEKGAVLRHD